MNNNKIIRKIKQQLRKVGKKTGFSLKNTLNDRAS